MLICASLSMSKPSLLNVSCSLTLITTYTSPLGPPFIPGSPSPLSVITDPLSTPAGILIFIFFFSLFRPLPPQSWHASSKVFPSPPHVGQVFAFTNCPNGVLCVYLTSPVPPQLLQVFTFVPGFAPVPSQVLHVSFLIISISFSTPKAASLNSITVSTWMSRPLADRLLLLVPPPPNMSNMSPKISSNPAPPAPEKPPKPCPFPFTPSWPNWS